MKLLKWLCSIFLVLGLGLMIVGTIMGSNGSLIKVDRTNLNEFNHCTTKEEVRYGTKNIGSHLIYVAEDDFNDVSVVSILNGFITVVDTNYYDYVKISGMGIEVFDLDYVPNRGHNMHGHKFTSLDNEFNKIEYLDYDNEEHCDQNHDNGRHSNNCYNRRWA